MPPQWIGVANPHSTGGTAIALYLGHRRSIDFDLFKFSRIKDIDYTEPVEFIGAMVPENEIKEFLIEKATDFL